MAGPKRSGGAAATPTPKKQSKLAKSYLLAYNVIQTIGWMYLLFQLVTYYLPGGNPSQQTLWDKVWLSVVIFQNAAVLEVVHAMLGLVSSSVAITLMQVYSRVFLVWGVFLVAASVPGSVGLPLALFAWAITEIIRYSFYAFGVLGKVPHFLVFLRYTLFIALYPIGVSGELICMYRTQEEVGQTGMWSVTMPSAYNFVFNYQYFLIAYMVLYIPIFPMLYGHMFAQRKKILGGGKEVTKKSK